MIITCLCLTSEAVTRAADRLRRGEVHAGLGVVVLEPLPRGGGVRVPGLRERRVDAELCSWTRFSLAEIVVRARTGWRCHSGTGAILY